jgi:tetratricopeptide (TPR) repeat protein
LRVANTAHAGGTALGLLLGLALVARGRRRVVWAGLAAVAFALAVLGSTVARPYVNWSGQAALDLAYLGYLDLEAGRDESAARRLERAVALDAGHADWWYNLGVARLRLDHVGGAIESYDRAFALQPGNEQFRQARAELRAYAAARAAEEGYQRQLAGDAAGAVYKYREALDLDEGQARTWFNLGIAYHSLGQMGPARNAYRRAAALEPDNREFRRALAGLPAPNEPD